MTRPDAVWTSPISFAAAVSTLAVRDYGFPEAAETRAFVDGFGDLGLDAIAVAIGETTILEPEDVAPALAANPGSPLRILLLQAKRNERLNQHDVDLFGLSAQRFLTLSVADLRLLKPNPNAQVFIDILQAIRLAQPAALATAHVTLVFAYAGQWKDFNTVNVARQLAERNIRSSLPALRFEFVIWGDTEIVDAGHRVGPDRRKTLAAVRLMDLPGSEAKGFIGYVEARAIAMFASREQGTGRVPLDFLFFDNVRADLSASKYWERDNSGARAIAKALGEGRQGEFLVSHNGVVIVARAYELTAHGNEIVLCDPQIINGCQTVNTLVRHFSVLGNAHLPIKIVITDNEALKDRIVIAANTQANIEDYDILARHRGVRALEPYFQNAEKPMRQRIWLARRRGEQINWPWKPGETDYERVVTPRHLLEAYVGAVQGQPHVVHGDPGKTLEFAVSGEAFSVDHDPTLYRALAWLIVTGRRWARRTGRKWHDLYSRGGPGSYPARHHFVFALWQLAEPSPDRCSAGDFARSGSADERFQRLIDRLVDDGDALADAAGEAVEQAVRATNRRLDADLVRREFFARAVSDAMKAATDAL
ncbi:MAG: AIPR family protein [Hyphomicrobiaceae bacterium]